MEPSKCTKCGKEAIITLKYSGLSLCKRDFISFFERRVKRTIAENKYIQSGDRIAVALSGGKDSVSVLYLLDKFNKMNGKNVELFAITIDQGIKGYDDKLLENAKYVTELLGIKHYIFSFKDEIKYTIDEIAKARPGLCNCGVFRRHILNKKARELGATKLATGHNLDDEVESALLNFIEGSITRIVRGEGLINNKKLVKRIKPLKKSPEEEVMLYAQLIFPTLNFGLECPYRKEVIRKDVKGMIDELERRHPGIRYQILESYEKIRKAMLLGANVSKEVKECKICGEVSSKDICNACELKLKLEDELKQVAFQHQT
ncbi:MAG: TIGR00269 family protein [Thermoproteota archaeon]